MRGLAELMHHWGHEISGSDLMQSENTEYLQQNGVTITPGHRPENLKQPDLVVYSSAVGEDNIELQKARSLDVPVIKRAQMLGLIMQTKKYAIAICGTHGKTTTTSMVSWVFECAGLDPVTLVGGVDRNFGSTTRIGHGDLVIVEADEFDRSFLKLFPTHIIITTIDHDHFENYGSIDEVKGGFLDFIGLLPGKGKVFLCGNDLNSQAISMQIDRQCITYGIDCEGDVIASNIQTFEDITQFLVREGESCHRFSLKVPGRHNIQNALAAIAVGKEFQIPMNTILSALAGFKAVERRMDILHQSNDFVLIDDYAHHPTEISATLAAVKARWNRRTLVVFQPHLYSRTANFYREFAGSLSAADIVIVTGIYPARELPIAGVTSKMIVNECNNPDKVHYIEDKFRAADFIKRIFKSGDVVITMGAGDINRINSNLLSWQSTDSQANL